MLQGRGCALTLSNARHTANVDVLSERQSACFTEMSCVAVASFKKKNKIS